MIYSAALEIVNCSRFLASYPSGIISWIRFMMIYDNETDHGDCKWPASSHSCPDSMSNGQTHRAIPLMVPSSNSTILNFNISPIKKHFFNRQIMVNQRKRLPEGMGIHPSSIHGSVSSTLGCKAPCSTKPKSPPWAAGFTLWSWKCSSTLWGKVDEHGPFCSIIDLWYV